MRVVCLPIRMILKTYCACLLVLNSGCAASHRALSGDKIVNSLASHEASQRAFIQQYGQSENFKRGRPVQFQFSPDEHHAFFLKHANQAGGLALYEADLLSGKTRQIASSESLLGAVKRRRSVSKSAPGVSACASSHLAFTVMKFHQRVSAF